MTVRRNRATFEELFVTVESLVDQLKVLVSAVDDLRCEIEWQARNQSLARDDSQWIVAPSATPADCRPAEAFHSVVSSSVGGTVAQSAVEKLVAYEEYLTQGSRGVWLEEWAEHDDFEMPTGRVVPVDAQLWTDVLDIRPAHVVGEGCCCEEGEGGPYLLAWHCGEEFLLRELSDEEARQLQELCLAAQDEQTQQQPSAPSAATQLGLF